MTTASPIARRARIRLIRPVLLAVIAAAVLLALPAAASALPPLGPWSWSAPYTVTGAGTSHCDLLSKAPAGDIYAVSELYPTSGYPNLVVARVAGATGVAAWTQSTTGPWSLGVRAGDAATDTGGNLIVVGSAARGSSDEDCFVTKYSPTGVVKWSKTLDGGVNGFDALRAVTTDGAGNVYVGGRIQRSAGTWMGDLVIIKYSPKGKRLWKYVYSSTKDDWATDMTVDTRGNVYAACTVKATKGGGASIMTLSLSPWGTKRWSKVIKGLAADYAASEMTFSRGYVWVFGVHSWDGYRPVVMKYRTSGKLAWSTGVFAYGISWIAGTALDTTGRIYMAAVSYQDFGAGPISVGDLLVIEGRGEGKIDLYDDFFDDSAAPNYHPVRFEDVVLDAQGRAYCAGSVSLDALWSASVCAVVRHDPATDAAGDYDALWRLGSPALGGCGFSSLLRVGNAIYAAGVWNGTGTQQAVVDKLDTTLMP